MLPVLCKILGIYHITVNKFIAFIKLKIPLKSLDLLLTNSLFQVSVISQIEVFCRFKDDGYPYCCLFRFKGAEVKSLVVNYRKDRLFLSSNVD